MELPDISTVMVGEPDFAPDRCILLRAIGLETVPTYVWCGRSMGWLPWPETSTVFFRLFSDEDEAFEAADKYVTLPVQEW